ncbi:O-antigen ligase family protein [Desulfosediminicola flagellatus]|uniref:O-antigen ligase family protein n=1 Tax=Desulfosediminicola flagellatus TaxID=2569541 RepID=UPI0010AD17F2|nr:O-antigen ligase family protein [Desulfosediminicola flagellatus]
MTRTQSFQHYATTAGQISVVLTCLFIPLSTSLMGLFSLLTMLFWLISGGILKLPTLVAKSPTVLVCITLFIYMAISIGYTSAPVSLAVDTLLKYRELLFIPAIITLLSNNQRYSRMAENSFLTGSIILMVISYGIYFSIIPPQKYGYSIMYHITHSFFMAALGFWAFQRLLENSKYRYFWFIVLLGVIVNIFHVNTGRTGMLIFLLLILFSVIQRLSFKKIVAAVVIAVALLSAAFIYSDNLSSRTQLALSEIQNYQPGKSRSSLGMRFDWWQNSVELIQEAPIFGHGAGSFTQLQKRLIANKKTMPTDNPHNEYLFISVQFGYVGLVMFLSLLLALIAVANSLTKNNRHLLQGVVVAMAAGCFINSFLYDTHQGHFFAFLSAVLVSKAPSLQLGTSTERQIANSTG